MIIMYFLQWLDECYDNSYEEGYIWRDWFNKPMVFYISIIHLSLVKFSYILNSKSSRLYLFR